MSTDWNGFTHIRRPLVSKAWMRPFHDHTFCTSRCCFTLIIVWTFKLVKFSTIARFILFNTRRWRITLSRISFFLKRTITWGCCCWLFLLGDALDETGTSVIYIWFSKVWAISISSSVTGTFTVPLTKSTTVCILVDHRPLERKLRRRWYCSLSFEANAKPHASSLTDLKFAQRLRIASWSWAC